jgi:hypothetical protein
MKTKIEEKTGSAIIVEGVVLTKNAISALKTLQDNDNDMLKECRNNIGDAICYMVQILDVSEMPEFKEKINRAVINLSYVREYIDDLEKP